MRRAIVAAAAFVLLALALHVLGVAGYQAGEAVTGVVLAGAAVGLTIFAAGGDGGWRRWLALPLATAALALVGPLHDAAPLSKGRLTAELDELDLHDFEIVSTELSGHSWCRPTCPVVVRRYAGPGIAPAGAVALVGAELSDEGLVPLAGLRLTARTREVTVRGEDLVATIAAAQSGAGIDVVLRVEARR